MENRNQLCLFDYILKNKNDFINKNYKGDAITVFPNLNVSNFTLWTEYYFRNDSNSIKIPLN